MKLPELNAAYEDGVLKFKLVLAFNDHELVLEGKLMPKRVLPKKHKPPQVIIAEQDNLPDHLL